MRERRIAPMVHLHNKLNEDAWKEVLRWESRFHGGYGQRTVAILNAHSLLLEKRKQPSLSSRRLQVFMAIFLTKLVFINWGDDFSLLISRMRLLFDIERKNELRQIGYPTLSIDTTGSSVVCGLGRWPDM